MSIYPSGDISSESPTVFVWKMTMDGATIWRKPSLGSSVINSFSLGGDGLVYVSVTLLADTQIGASSYALTNGNLLHTTIHMEDSSWLAKVQLSVESIMCRTKNGNRYCAHMAPSGAHYDVVISNFNAAASSAWGYTINCDSCTIRSVQVSPSSDQVLVGLDLQGILCLPSGALIHSAPNNINPIVLAVTQSEISWETSFSSDSISSLGAMSIDSSKNTVITGYTGANVTVGSQQFLVGDTQYDRYMFLAKALPYSESMCAGVLSSSRSVCSGRGACINGNCNCPVGWMGIACQKPIYQMSEIRERNLYCFGRYFNVTITGPQFAQNVVWEVIKNDTQLFNNTAPQVYATLYMGFSAYQNVNGSFTVRVKILDDDGSILVSKTLDSFVSCKYCPNVISADSTFHQYCYGSARITPLEQSGFVRTQSRALYLIYLGGVGTYPSDTSWNFKIIDELTGLPMSEKEANLYFENYYDHVYYIRPRSITGIRSNIRIYTSFAFTTRNERYIVYYNESTGPGDTISENVHLSVFPAQGLSLSDNFTLATIPPQNHSYVFSYSYLDESTGKYVSLNSYSTKSNLTTVLPPGVAQNNYNLRIRVIIMDLDIGAIGESSQTLRVLAPNNEQAIDNAINKALESNNIDTLIVATSLINDSQVSNISSTNKLITKVLDFIGSSIDENTTSIDIGQRTLAVEVLTRKTKIMNTELLTSALHIVENIIVLTQRNNSLAIIDQSTATTMTDIISNIASNFTDPLLATRTVNTAQQLANYLITDKVLGSQESLYQSTNFELSVGRTNLSVAQILHKSENTTNYLSLPASFGADVKLNSVAYSVLIFKKNPYLTSNQTNEKQSAVIDVKFIDSDSSTIPVVGLSEGILLHFNGSIDTTQSVACKFWDEQKLTWSSDGCEVESIADSSVVCRCNHTTSFSVFILENGDKRTPIGLRATGIVFNTIYIVLCCIILVSITLLRNEQPLRTRYMAPFMGMIALVVESVLQGWVRNSLSLADKKLGSDAVSYIIILLANPLTIAALFTFFWQQVRFILLQNIYYLMPKANRKHMILVNKILASKIVFFTLTVLVAIVSMGVFAILVGFSAYYNNRNEFSKRNIAVTVQAILFAGIMILIALLILLALIYDYILSLKTEISTESVVADNNGDIIEKKSKKHWLHLYAHFRNDPLTFRLEACVILVAALLVLVLYSLGIASLNADAQSAIVIVRTVFEIVLGFVSIAAFGGFVCVITFMTFISKIRNKDDSYEAIPSNGSTMTDSDQKILDLLRHDHGYKLVYTYCQQEFSLENLLLWKDLEEVRLGNLTSTDSNRLMDVRRMKELYLDLNSERQVNMSNQQRKKVLEQISGDSVSASQAEEAYRILFGICLTNLSDTLSRLQSTAQFAQYLEIQSKQQELKSTLRMN